LNPFQVSAAAAAAAYIAGLVGHQVLGVVECIKAKLLADGGQLVPACATLYAMGIEVVTPCTLPVELPQQPGSWQQQEMGGTERREYVAPEQQQQQQLTGLEVDLSALEHFRWGCKFVAGMFAVRCQCMA
jgi:hypothetical protein